MGSINGFCMEICSKFFEYDTVKIVHVTNKKVGAVKRLIQLVVIAYIVGFIRRHCKQWLCQEMNKSCTFDFPHNTKIAIQMTFEHLDTAQSNHALGFVIVYKKGYQDTDAVVSSTTSKVKGVAWTNYTELNVTSPGEELFRIWDVADYVIPPQQSDAFFVMTNVILTPNQTQSLCPEDPSIPGARCSNDSECKRGRSIVNGNGIMTGKCIDFDSTRKSCEVHAWCPIEIDVTPNVALLEGTSNFTVLLKNNIVFNKFNARRRNILDSQNSTYLKSCHFVSGDPDNHLCPVFELGSIVSLAGVKNYSDIAVLGGVTAINIKWTCDLDYSIDYCLPEYSFQRLDEENAKLAPGDNFRYASFYEKDGREYRELVKAYGIQFYIKVTGTAGKFSMVPLMLNIGSGIGVLTIAVLVSDFILCYIVEKRKFYYQQKYHQVNEESEDNEDSEDDTLLIPPTAETGENATN